MSQMSLQKNNALLFQNLQKIIPFFELDDVREILLQADGSVILYRFGRRELSEVTFSEAEKTNIAKLISHHNEKSIHYDGDSLSGTIDELNCRVHIIAPPTSWEGTVMSFRIRPKTKIALPDYLEKGLMDFDTFNFLKKAIHDRKNIIIAGGTGSGKTTLLNALIDEIESDVNQRLYIVEDNREIICNHLNRVMIYIKDSDFQAPQKALAEALRMSPDRIIYGELRNGYVAMGLINAWNTGHEGGLTTLHASSAFDVLQRIKSLAEQVAGVNLDEKTICSAIGLIIYIKKVEEQGQTKFLVEEALEPLFDDRVKFRRIF